MKKEVKSYLSGFMPVFLFVIVAALIFVVGIIYRVKKAYVPKPVVCIQEITRCPDGSYVPRIPPNCDFAECLKNSTTSIIASIKASIINSTSTLLVGDKTVEQRLVAVFNKLHTPGSGDLIQSDFPDTKLVYTDTGDGTRFPLNILPFKYYYSEEADRTFNICKIGYSVFVCRGKLDRLITKEDIDSGRCFSNPIYLTDSRMSRNK